MCLPGAYLWSSSSERSLETQAGWLRMARPMRLLDSSFSRLSTCHTKHLLIGTDSTNVQPIV